MLRTMVASCRSGRNRRGFVLLVSMGMLALLAVLGVTFVTIVTTEGQVSASMLEQVRAKMLADAGVQRGAAELSRGVDNYIIDRLNPPADSWYGWDPLATVDPGTGRRLAQLGDLAPSNGLRASFHAGYTSAGAIATNGRQRAYSGAPAAGTFEAEGDTYVLRILDCASQLYINGRQPNLNHMLVALAQGIILMSTPALLPADNPIPDLAAANAILADRNLRAGRVFASKSELREVLIQLNGGNVDTGSRKYATLEPFITDQAWVDLQVLRPAPQPQTVSAVGPISNGQRLAAGPFYQNLTFQRDPDGRAPINLNTASAPVLMATMTGLRAVRTAYESGTGQWSNVDHAGGYIALAEAQAIANQIIARRVADPFETWEEFDTYLGQLAANVALQGQVPNLARKLEIIRANANPNSLSNKLNPGTPVYRPVDKSDLNYAGADRFAGVNPVGATTAFNVGTTEFCFSSMGYYEIRSLGRVTSNGGVVRGQSQVRNVVRLYNVARLTTQADFTNATNATLPAQLKTFPNVPGVVFSGGGEDRDGQVALAELAQPAPAAPPPSNFAADLDNSLQANPSNAPRDLVNYSSSVDPAVPAYPSNDPRPLPPGATRSVFDNTTQYTSDLVPDGMLVSRRRDKTAMYDPTSADPTVYPDANLSNLNLQQGSLEFWYKPTVLYGANGQTVQSPMDGLTFYSVPMRDGTPGTLFTQSMVPRQVPVVITEWVTVWQWQQQPYQVLVAYQVRVAYQVIVGYQRVPVWGWQTQYRLQLVTIRIGRFFIR
ncbi:MAG: hypothetical protein HZA54_07745, partial [Planctomycetes bacterium]|nr:hypothetical protein [Planctomycetota bacterium]